MIVRSKAKRKNRNVNLVYEDCDDFGKLPPEKCRQAYGVCFLGEKIVISKTKRGKWSLVGGTIEENESPEETLIREIKEESNMEVITHRPIGYQYIEEDDIYQLRYVCTVKPFGEFIKDPAGDIVSINLINPSEFEKYISWGNIGKRLIQRALLLNQNRHPGRE